MHNRRKRKKTNKFRKENQLLTIMTVSVSVFAIIFLLFIFAKNDFNIRTMIPDESNSTSTSDNNIESVEFPELQGKASALLMAVSASGDYQRFCALIQIDLDNKNYEICSFPVNTVISGKTVGAIYSESGPSGVRDAFSSLLEIPIDRYICVTEPNFKKFVSYLGNVQYTFPDHIKYSGSGEDFFSLRIKSGEQTLTGDQMIKLCRYSGEIQKDFKLQNELLLEMIAQGMSEENYADGELLFKKLVNVVKTDMTVSDFTNNVESLSVLTDDNYTMNLVTVETDGNYSEAGFEISGKMKKNIQKTFEQDE